MAMLVMPLRTDLRNYTVEVDLEGESYKLALAWSLSESAWYLSVYDVNGDPIALGRRVVIDWPLLRGVTTPGRPPGDFIALDTRGVDRDPALGELGGDVPLVYVESTGL